MKSKNLMKLVGLFILVCAFSFSGWWYYANILAPKLEAKKWEERAKVAALFKRASENVEKLWFKGDQESKWGKEELNCPEILGNPGDVTDIYLRCNPSFLQCYFGSGKSITVDYGKEKFNVVLVPEFKTQKGQAKVYQIANRSMSHHPLSFSSGVRIKLKIKELPDYSQDIFLEDSCHEAFLPQRKYALGEPSKNQPDFLWDSIGRLIIFDRYLVTERDVRDWADFVKLPDQLDTKIRQKIGKREPYLPATGFTKNEMESFCNYKGKNVMSALVFDAASFFPLKLNDPLPSNVTRGPYPWGYRQKDSFVYKISQGDLTQINSQNCQIVFAQECKNTATWKAFSRDSGSFAGLFQILGGFMEYLDNPVISSENLKASSVYFPFKSNWHRLGRRAYWDGEGNQRDNFKIMSFESGKSKEVPLDLPFEIEKFDVAFRCMREMLEVSP